MSRYYDPVTHRFLNSDGYFQSGGGILDVNMNAYCRNNPVMNYDSNGESVIATILIGATVGGLIHGGIEIVSQALSGKGVEEIDWWSVTIETVTGVALGALPGFNLGTGALIFAKAGISIFNTVSHGINNGDNEWTIVKNTITNSIFSAGFASIKHIVFKKTVASHLKHAQPSKINKWAQKVTPSDGATISLIGGLINNSNKNVTAPTIKCCRGCGRPIGTQAWQCSSGWSY